MGAEQLSVVPAKDIFKAMEEVLKSDTSLKNKINASVKFIIDDGETYTINAKKNSDSSAVDGPADLVATSSLETIQQMLTKKLTPQQAFMKGKIKCKGKMSIAMKLPILVNATRKYILAKYPTSKL